MNILMVLSTKKYPPDGRVEREARDLIRDGHNLFLMARRGPGQSAREVVDGVGVIRIPLPFQRMKAASDVTYFFFQRYFIFFYIIWACRKHSIDALHVHDLPYAFATAWAGRCLGLPVVFDMHEWYTVMLRASFDAKAYRKFKPFAWVLLAMMRMEERIACRWASKVIVVAEEHIERIRLLGVSRENIVVVTNTEDSDYFSSLPIDEAILEEYSGDFVILYVGVINPHRGLSTAIKAMARVIQEIPNAKLVIVGDGVTRSELVELVENMKLEKHVVFPGFQPFAKLPSYIEASVCGLIPHISTPHIETTMPNKIFQFMMLGKPVIVSSTRPMTRVVNETNCGLTFQVEDDRSLAETIIKLKDERLCRELGENGRTATQDRYNWQETVRALLAVYAGHD